MPPTLFRTHVSSLTDDELVLLDVLALFDILAVFEDLRRDGFTESFNCPPHGLDDRQLHDVIDRLVREGILHVAILDSERPHYGITALGGELWEAERTPVWERYVTNRFRRRDARDGKWIMSVWGTSHEACADYWRIGSEAHALYGSPIRVRFFRLAQFPLLSRKTFPAVHVAVGVGWEWSAPRQIEEYVPFDRALYERRRTWWQTVSQLQKFVGRDK